MNKQITDIMNMAQGSRFQPCSLSLDPCSSKGFTLIELVIVISIIGFLASMLMSRVLFYQEMAEKAAMQQVVGALQSAMVIQYGHGMVQGTGAWVNAINTENPMEWLSQKPINYAGEFKSVKPASIEPGNWAFDLHTHELVYVPKHTEYLAPSKDGAKFIRYRARLTYESRLRGKEAKALTGVIFSPVEPYQWMIREN